MRTSKRIIKIICFILVLALLNKGMTWLLTPFCTPSSQMWDLYRNKADQELDMVYVGDSVCYEGIDPSVVDELTGHHSYNMGTNAQSLTNSFNAIRTAYEDHEITHAVLMLDETLLTAGTDRFPRPEAAFYSAKNRGANLSQWFENTAAYIFDERYVLKPDSVNFFFPWTYNRINGGWDGFMGELRIKLGIDEMEMATTNNLRYDTGYKPFERIMNYNKVGSALPMSWDGNNLSQEAFETLEQTIAYCQERDIELLVIAPYFPTSQVLRYGSSYETRRQYLESWMADRGQAYYDFNLAKSELIEYNKDGFKDWFHMNDIGAQIFSRSLADFMNKLDAGEDVSDLFYTWNEYLASIDYVDSNYLVLDSVPGEGITVKTVAYTGSQVQLEYQFELLNRETEEYEVIQEWSRSSSVTYQPTEDGRYRFNVRVRQVGATKTETYHRRTVNYYAE